MPPTRGLAARACEAIPRHTSRSARTWLFSEMPRFALLKPVSTPPRPRYPTRASTGKCPPLCEIATTGYACRAHGTARAATDDRKPTTFTCERTQHGPGANNNESPLLSHVSTRVHEDGRKQVRGRRRVWEGTGVSASVRHGQERLQHQRTELMQRVVGDSRGQRAHHAAGASDDFGQVGHPCAAHTTQAAHNSLSSCAEAAEVTTTSPHPRALRAINRYFRKGNQSKPVSTCGGKDGVELILEGWETEGRRNGRQSTA